MASLGGIDLELEATGVVAGAVFFDTELPSEPPAGPDPVQLFAVDGHEARLFSWATAVSLLNGSYGPGDVASTALEVAQRALDLSTITGFGASSLPGADGQHVVWWRDSSATSLRIVVSRPLHVTTSVGARSATHAASPTSTWDPTMQFFRLSQLADDVFEAYRNAYLALEAALDATVPPGAPAREGAWMEFALARVPGNYGLDLPRLLASASRHKSS